MEKENITENVGLASCFRCKKELTVPRIVSRTDTCPSCGADLRCCRNCRFHDGAAYNACRETQAERVLDKQRSNFCDFFRFREAAPAGEKAPGTPGAARDKLEELFGKKKT
ncbi:MAG TPA: hypothetical protein PLB96_01205 [Syntrophales bacterium]|nr:hypothetical protein [Syntrophales bacterium]